MRMKDTNEDSALAASELRYRRLFESAKDGILILDAETGIVVDVNPFLTRLLGYPYENFVGKAVWELGPFKDIVANRDNFTELQQKEYIRYEDKPLETADGQHVDVEFVSNVYLADNKKVIQCNIRDITEQRKLEAELRQAQKMEAVGRLAGGVAHDFNNMLQVILGHTEIALEQADRSRRLFADLTEIQKAAKRSAGLTRQLLAFARKQKIEPEILDLNDAVSGMLKMLRRLIGEDIHLAWMPGIDLRPVEIDPSQVDQIFANLCLNARDAITGAGKVTLETGNVTIDAAYCAGHAEAVPGEYVFLSVSDNGRGMDKETLAHIFEPFFTTKEIGEGTGLGLATVYGIVKQNGGFIYAYSEPGIGTTFKIYLPQVVAEAVQPDLPVAVKPDISVLFMSGYTADVMIQRGVLEQDKAFIAKPFSQNELARKIRELLDSREAAKPEH